jgi:hypothetical protein
MKKLLILISIVFFTGIFSACSQETISPDGPIQQDPPEERP